jgi:NAD(P)-dependent dehydrogenase (short-subunit alcohol dehydrogenase family)
LARDVQQHSDVPDIIVNNAGIGVSGPLLATSLELWRRLVDVNLWGVIHGCRLFAPMLVERGRGGHIVNVASAAGFGPLRALPAYGTTKAAVIHLSECLRLELAPHRIGVSVVCPGLVNTPIVRSTEYVGERSGAEGRRRDAAAALYDRRNYPPERVAERIVDAVRHNRGVVPVTVEAHAFRLGSRLAPGLTQRVTGFGAFV